MLAWTSNCGASDAVYLSEKGHAANFFKLSAISCSSCPLTSEPTKRCTLGTSGLQKALLGSVHLRCRSVGRFTQYGPQI